MAPEKRSNMRTFFTVKTVLSGTIKQEMNQGQNIWPNGEKKVTKEVETGKIETGIIQICDCHYTQPWNTIRIGESKLITLRAVNVLKRVILRKTASWIRLREDMDGPLIIM